ncbi:hypothetical protein J4216_05680 [Candidatus Woesearchaeota archaeon]|nr:hypothetical protein [Candidatus Woesearchaeota archaeon]
MSIVKVGSLIDEFERNLNELKSMVESKQNERFLTSYVWMIDKLERDFVSKISELKENLDELKDKYVTGLDNHNQFDTLINLCDDLDKIIKDILKFYKTKPGYSEINLRLNNNLPILSSKVKSMKNRFDIIKNQVKKFTFDDFYL